MRPILRKSHPAFFVLLLGLVFGCSTGRQHLAEVDIQSSALPLNAPNATIQSTTEIESPTSLSRGGISLASAEDVASESNDSDSQLTILTPAPSEGLSLIDLEQLALSNNPTISQQSASAQQATGIRDQVGRYANPSVGYFGSQLADAGTDQHGVFVEQEFVTAGKLELNRRVLNQAIEVQRWNIESQKYRVMTDVRMKFYETLAAQRRIHLIQEFKQVADQGVELAEMRNRAKEAARTDFLQAKIQLNEVEVTLQQAEYAYRAAWKELVATVGLPQMAPTELLGELPELTQQKEWDQTYLTLLSKSPELQAARAKVAKARANLSRQEVQAIPNVTAQLGAGVDNGTGSGLINLQISAPIPVFNNNSGNVSAAYAEYCRATHEVRRLEMAIQSRLALVSKEYDSARVAVEKYNEQILPQAAETLSLSEQAYNAGEFSFLQVLIVRRTYFDSNLNYIAALASYATAQAQVDGLLLTGGLDANEGFQDGDELRGQAFSQQ